ncbi:uncharacterized protein LOC122267094 isoform X2 [Penaeus japonicus]|nr:uncharacterized protein LOC122267094 isoform X2 [Penaeus japonicus]XP_042893011.1 uncharacterized protein LOC122267094 isoform X2 [Penaeus japonicus]
MEEEVTCVVCSELYTRGSREPVVLPLCGHTFCRPCLCNLENTGRLSCPTCRQTYAGPPVDKLPTVFALLSLSEHFRKSEGHGCQRHGSPVEFWCRSCQLPLCGHCLLDEHVKDGHRVVRGTDFIAEQKEQILSECTMLIQDISNRKGQCVNRFSEWIAQIIAGVEESAVLWNSTQNVQNIMNDVADATNIESILVSSSMLGSLKEEVMKVAPRDTRSRTASDCSLRCSSCSEMDSASLLGLLRQESSPDVEYQETEFEETEQTNAPEENIPNLTASVSDVAVPEDKTDSSSSDSSPPRQDSLGNAPLVARQVSSSSSIGRETSQTPRDAGVTTLFGTVPWPLRCCVVGPGGRRGKLRWEGGRLHMYALGEEIEEPHFMVQMSVLQYLVPEDYQEVFLVLETDGRCLGRVYIRLWGRIRRAQHFLALCLGSLGPSYRKSVFHGVAKRGAPGETLAGGKYLTPEGLTSVQALTGHLEWGGGYIKEKQRGLVVGANAGKPELDAFFHICMKDQPGRRFACAFGEVIQGMEVLHAAVTHLRNSDVTISDVGVVLASTAP